MNGIEYRTTAGGTYVPGYSPAGDVVMPGISGVQLHRELLEIYPGLPVLYMSGYTENAVVHLGVVDPDVQFLQKPFTRESLCGKVRRVLDAAASAS